MVVLELPEPLTIRRSVAVSTAVSAGEVIVQGMRGVRVDSAEQARGVAAGGDVAVLVAPVLAPVAAALGADVIVDARLAKRNIDTGIDDADLVVALGPGFSAGTDCDAVIETMRGHDLGRVIWRGSARADTATPARLGGQDTARVLRAPADGVVRWQAEIGDVVPGGRLLGSVGSQTVTAPFEGVLRGAIRPGTMVQAGLKIADIDPRADPIACRTISDKALAVGGGVLEAVLAWRSGRTGQGAKSR